MQGFQLNSRTRTASQPASLTKGHPEALSLEGWRDGLQNLTKGRGGMEGIPPGLATATKFLNHCSQMEGVQRDGMGKERQGPQRELDR